MTQWSKVVRSGRKGCVSWMDPKRTVRSGKKKFNSSTKIPAIHQKAQDSHQYWHSYILLMDTSDFKWLQQQKPTGIFPMSTGFTKSCPPPSPSTCIAAASRWAASRKAAAKRRSSGGWVLRLPKHLRGTGDFLRTFALDLYGNLLGLKLPRTPWKRPKLFATCQSMLKTSKVLPFPCRAAASSTLPASIKDQPPNTWEVSTNRNRTLKFKLIKITKDKLIDEDHHPKYETMTGDDCAQYQAYAADDVTHPQFRLPRELLKLANNTSASLTASTARHKWKKNNLHDLHRLFESQHPTNLKTQWEAVLSQTILQK